MNAISLFSGVGGLDLAAEAAGIEPVLPDSFCATMENAAQRVQYMNELAAIAKVEGRTK